MQKIEIDLDQLLRRGIYPLDVDGQHYLINVISVGEKRKKLAMDLEPGEVERRRQSLNKIRTKLKAPFVNGLKPLKREEIYDE